MNKFTEIGLIGAVGILALSEISTRKKLNEHEYRINDLYNAKKVQDEFNKSIEKRLKMFEKEPE